MLTLIGSPDASYAVRGTQLPRPSAGLFLDKVSITAGSIITGGASLTPGVKELPPHLERQGMIPKLRWLSRKYVVFWDEEAKRGWLINGTSALLHIVRASLAHYEHDDFSSCFLFDKHKMNNLPQHQYKPNTAIGVLIDQGNQSLAIYPDVVAQKQDTSIDGGSSTRTQTSTFFLLGDLIKQHLSALEQMVDMHSHLAGRDGINLRARVRKHLEGWDFADLAKDYDPTPRVATIPMLSYGWVDFVRSIGAITLFGRGFGELIRPVATPGLCERWAALPQQDYLLAASFADLRNIMERHGDAFAAPPELAPGILWHSPEDTCAACPCKLPEAKHRRTGYHVDPVQVLVPSCLRGRATSGQLGELEQDAAVVFGHSPTWGYRWPERGTVEVPAKDFVVPLRNRFPARLLGFKIAKPEKEAPNTGGSDTDADSLADTSETTATSIASRISTSDEPGEVLVEASPPPSSLRASLRDLLRKRRNSLPLEQSDKKLKIV